jgi:hypothetical protein
MGHDARPSIHALGDRAAWVLAICVGEVIFLVVTTLCREALSPFVSGPSSSAAAAWAPLGASMALALALVKIPPWAAIPAFFSGSSRPAGIRGCGFACSFHAEPGGPCWKR